MGPPAEAVAACENQTVGAPCNVIIHGETVESTCSLRSNGDGPLACRPRGPRNADGSVHGPGNCPGHKGGTCDHGVDGKPCGCMGAGGTCDHGVDGKPCGCQH